MKKRRPIITCGLILLLLVLLVFVGPFLVPVPPLEGTKPIEELLDDDSQILEIDGLDVHYKIQGNGDPALILLHGFGASVFSWREVMGSLSQYGTVIAYDRPAFGLTERPTEWEGENPYSLQAQVDLLAGLMDAMQIDRAVLVGNSAGGTICVHFALQNPERVAALILVDAAIYSGGGVSGWLKPILRTPQVQHLGPLIARQIQVRGPDLIDLAWHDPSRLTAEDLAGYTEPLMVEGWDEALWQMTLASDGPDLGPMLGDLSVPTLVITGDDDRIVPTQQSVRLADEIPGAVLSVLADCGHVPHEECPDAFLSAVADFMADIDG